MTKSEIFKAAHALAKIALVKMGGDYAAYFSHYLKVVTAAAKNNMKKMVHIFVNAIATDCGAPSVYKKTFGRSFFSTCELDCWLVSKGFDQLASKGADFDAKMSVSTKIYRG